MLKNLNIKNLLLSLILLSASVANAATFSFIGINPDEVDLTGQLSLEVTQVANSVDFKISNASPGQVSIVTNVYFDFLGTNLFSDLDQTGQLGNVSFVADALDNSNFAEGENLNPDFTTNAIAFRTQQGGVSNGINVGEFLILSALLTNNTDIAGLINSGDLRIGLRIQGFLSGGSESYVTNPSAVPLPAAGWLFGSALIGLMGLRRKMH